MIYFDADKQIFHLTNGQVSYIIGVEEGCFRLSRWASLPPL